MTFSFSDLPPELQALIFEVATDGDPENAPNLSLVSRSAAEWVQPRMFHIVVLQTPSSVHSLQLESPEFLHLHVKRLCITFGSVTMDDASAILSICTGTVDLAFWLAYPEGSNTSNANVDKPSMARVVSQLPLQRTELPCEQLVQIEREHLRTGSLPVWCTTLTNLKVLYWHLASMDDHIFVPLLQHLDALTHLAIDWCMFIPELHERVNIASFLETKPLLEIVIVDAVTG
ncbi:hypothetical protein BKA70DRAFT_1308128 [Coprinopsis sp. MPI-PUGE-AT-0042]|nr:hypothetical protein BKA70DRAFT_1308128 [Coprinopsis sp. MPI-PUGE-AT-0042]